MDAASGGPFPTPTPAYMLPAHTRCKGKESVLLEYHQTTIRTEKRHSKEQTLNNGGKHNNEKVAITMSEMENLISGQAKQADVKYSASDIVQVNQPRMEKVPTIRILNKGETYTINRAVDQQCPIKTISEVQDCSNTKEIEMEIIQEDDVKSNTNKDLPQHNESWNTVTPSKKRKINSNTNDRRTTETERQQWLQEIPTQNSFSSLTEEMDTDPTEKPRTHTPKPPPIYIDATIIDPLIDLLNSTAGKENYIIKQLKLDQVKAQTNTAETYRIVTKALKEKNAGYHTYQPKSDRSYKAVIRGLHPKTNTNKICEELAKIGHQDNTESMSTPNTQHVMNNNNSNTNTVRNRSYSQVVNQSSPLDNQEQNNHSNDDTEIKELIKHSIKNA
ncbi:probable serine/threonine-protein kinase mkcB [Bombus vosnesenskii]|uniref:Probable serine/threonine-protein kinase mkcB n=1 Tax=Bombus vosnesenskii TaxID=207650 RepID=A0A6J3LCE1_9HYME|nr:probable serine/threonine-protein kinase mkcB [Bombus vosnesenskii]